MYQKVDELDEIIEIENVGSLLLDEWGNPNTLNTFNGKHFYFQSYDSGRFITTNAEPSIYIASTCNGDVELYEMQHTETGFGEIYFNNAGTPEFLKIGNDRHFFELGQNAYVSQISKEKFFSISFISETEDLQVYLNIQTELGLLSIGAVEGVEVPIGIYYENEFIRVALDEEGFYTGQIDTGSDVKVAFWNGEWYVRKALRAIQKGVQLKMEF